MARGKLNESTLMKALEWAYEQGLAGIPGLGFESVVELAASYRRDENGQPNAEETDRAVRRLIRWQVAKAGGAGFVTGLGGLLILPLTMPANIAAVLLVQLRMIAAIAHLGGHDIHSDQVRTMCFLCVCGNGAADIAKDVGIQLGRKLTEQAIKKLSSEALTKINQRVGFRLMTKFGEKGIVNLGKMVPIAGGLVGGGFDAASTRVVGGVARRTFIAATN